MRPGENPASAAPRRKRRMPSSRGVRESAIMMVITPQLTMMRNSQIRAPVLVRSWLLGTWKMM